MLPAYLRHVMRWGFASISQVLAENGELSEPGEALGENGRGLDGDGDRDRGKKQY